MTNRQQSLSESEPRDAYRRNLAHFQNEMSSLEGRSRKFSLARLVAFIAAAGALVMIFLQAGSPRPFGYAAAAVACLLFGALVLAHDRVIRRLRTAKIFTRLNTQALGRLDRQWDEMPLRASLPAGGAGTYAGDLGLFGRASLAHLLGTVASPPGTERLARWLIEPASPEEVRRRQEAVQELAGKLELRQELEGRGAALEGEKLDPEPFLSWAEGSPWLLGKSWLLWLARALTLASGLLTLAATVGWVPWQVVSMLWLANLAIGYGSVRRTHAIFARVSAREGSFAAYAALFETLERQRFESPTLVEIVQSLGATGVSVHQEMARLHKAVELSDLRFSSFHFVPQALVLWDFHVLGRIEGWQRQAGGHVRDWFRVLGDFEALCALAGLSFDNPAWVFPVVEEGGDEVFEAKDLGHPLLAAGQRIGNDVAVGPPGTFLLVTGSNMSGKSTLLRSLGVNAILAQAGGPVCASFLRMPPLRLATSIQVEDSLEEGTSFFMAELQRLKAVVDDAEAGRDAEGRILFYLLDEILRGTNSRERQIAVHKVLVHLLSKGAIGAVSTHDLELANLGGLASAARSIHFRETLHAPGSDGPVMTFDYKARPGVATTTNALQLLALVGLDFDEEVGGEERLSS